MSGHTGGSTALSTDPTEARAGQGLRAWLYCRDGEDSAVPLEETRLPDPDTGEMMWVDVDLDRSGELEVLWNDLGIEEAVRDLDGADRQPQLTFRDDFLDLRVIAVAGDDGFEPLALYCLVGSNWIVTLHSGELDLVNDFNEPFHGETDLGGLDGPAFLSLVLDWQIGGYFGVIEDLQADVDRLDEDLLGRSADQVSDEVTILRRLQELRQQVRYLRQVLSPHREIFGRLSHPEADAVTGSDSGADYERISERVQQALDSLDTTREMIIGSFEIFTTRTAQATNDIMKRLTIISVLLLPASVLAGIMGMNFRLGFFDRDWVFWGVLGVMAAIAGVTLVVARRRGWI